MSNKSDQNAGYHDYRALAENRARIEAAIATDQGKTLSPEQTQALIHELRVHQIELEMQNDELHRTQRELEITWENYFELYTQAPVGYCHLSANGQILEANLTAAKLIGQSRAILVDQSLSQFVYSPDRDNYYLFHKRLFETGLAQECELRLLKADGSPLWVKLTANVAQHAQSNFKYRVVINDIQERKLTQDRICTVLAEKEFILHEVHHRIKNNMNLVHSLLLLQAEGIVEAKAKDIVQDAAGRVRSMILLYQKLYQTVGEDMIPVQDYLSVLANEILAVFPHGQSIKLAQDLDDFAMDANRLQIMGIIVNELITNSMKHAFADYGNAAISLSAKLTENLVTLCVKDNGKGLPVSRDSLPINGFGLQLVDVLIAQLRGNLLIGRDQGTNFTITFDWHQAETH